jgi:predicted nucleotidyltransferase component of viral defense system
VLNKYSLEQWVAGAEQSEEEFRQAVHTILAAIANTPNLQDNMIIKGGILLAIRYQSDRFTRDIDFSSPKGLKDIPPEKVEEQLNQSLAEVVEELDYNLDCRVQSCKVSPKNKPEASFPNIELKIAHAFKGSKKHKRLLMGNCPTIVSIDYSLNEQTPFVENLKISDNEHIIAYALTDIISEKYRAILQQIERNRQRRQDIFDLYFLLDLNDDFSGEEIYNIHCSLMTKARSRGLEPTIDSMDNPEIYERSKADYPSLKDEVEGELPDFDIIFQRVKTFYRSLGWPKQ